MIMIIIIIFKYLQWLSVQVTFSYFLNLFLCSEDKYWKKLHSSNNKKYFRHKGKPLNIRTLSAYHTVNLQFSQEGFFTVWKERLLRSSLLDVGAGEGQDTHPLLEGGGGAGSAQVQLWALILRSRKRRVALADSEIKLLKTQVSLCNLAGLDIHTSVW